MNCYDVTYRSSPQSSVTGCGSLSPPHKKWKTTLCQSLPTHDDGIFQSSSDVTTNDVKRKSPTLKSEQPVSTLRLSSRCVLLTYFDGDVTSCVDEHFDRALRQSSFSASGKLQCNGDERYGPGIINNIDRAAYSMMSQQQHQQHHHQLHQATGDELQLQSDWLPFGGDPNYYCNHLQTTDQFSPNWMTQSLRLRPYYVWPNSTSPSSVSGGHRSHIDDLMTSSMTSSFSAAPPYVDYQSLIATSRHSASLVSDSSFHERNDVTGGGPTSISEDVSVSGVNWTPLPPFGVELNRHASTSAVTSVHAVVDTRCHVNDEFSVVTSSCQTLLTGGDGSTTKTSHDMTSSRTKDLYWF